MNGVRGAIFDALNNDSTLASIITGVFWRKAPQGTDMPVVIYSKISGSRMWTFDGPAMHEELYLIKGVGFADDAEDIDQRCQDILESTTLSAAGYDFLLQPMGDDDSSYEELEYGETYDHSGTFYRVVSERASS